jgi:IS5 family transposase
MDKVVAWQPLNDLIEPVYSKTGSKVGHPPYPLETMLRIHLMQQWYDLSDPAMEDTLVELPTMYFFYWDELAQFAYAEPSDTSVALHLLWKYDLSRSNHYQARPGIPTLPVIPHHPTTTGSTHSNCPATTPARGESPRQCPRCQPPTAPEAATNSSTCHCN